MRTTFPTLAETPRAEWPAILRVYPPDPARAGDVERVLCRHCGVPVRASELHDFRALSVAQRALLHLDVVFCCDGCFTMMRLQGRVLHGPIAAALGFHPNTLAAIETPERVQASLGHYVRTLVNQHLVPPGKG